MPSRLALVERQRILVFTDLDGTLLDPVHYDWQAASSTLTYLRERNILLIPCTSKTRAEIDLLRRKMRHEGPYIAENGGILVLPWKFLGRNHPRLSKPNDLVLQLGGSYADARRGLTKLARLANVSVRGFHQMTVDEVAHATGLTKAQARRARLREASEPFLFLQASASQIRKFCRAARDHGFQVAEGARFWHLTIGADKGQTMALLLQLSQIIGGARTRTIAAGDASIDLPMLQQADIPILMPGRDGHFDPRMTGALPRALHAQSGGPQGWADAVRRAISLCPEGQPIPLKNQRPAVTAGARRVPALHEVFPERVRVARAKSRATPKRVASQ